MQVWGMEVWADWQVKGFTERKGFYNVPHSSKQAKLQGKDRKKKMTKFYFKIDSENKKHWS